MSHKLLVGEKQVTYLIDKGIWVTNILKIQE